MSCACSYSQACLSPRNFYKETKIHVQSYSSGNWGFYIHPCEQPHRHHSSSSQMPTHMASPSVPPGAPDPGQASHAYCDFLHPHKSLLIPSKPFLISIEAPLPLCFAQWGLAQSRGAGPQEEGRQSRTGPACGQASPCIPVALS